MADYARHIFTLHSMSHFITTPLKQYECKQVSSDAFGNPRYVVHFLSLGLTNYPDRTPAKLRKLGLTKYRGKDFSGGYVFYAYNITRTLDELYCRLNPEGRTRAKRIISTNSRLLCNIYTGENYSDITWHKLQSRLDEYPELARHEANSACYFEDATQGHVDANGNFLPIRI